MHSNFLRILLICQFLLIVDLAPSPKSQIDALHREILAKWDAQTTVTSDFSWKCEACKLAVNSLTALFGTDLVKDCAAAFTNYICKTLHIVDNHVCRAVVSEYKVSCCNLREISDEKMDVAPGMQLNETVDT